MRVTFATLMCVFCIIGIPSANAVMEFETTDDVVSEGDSLSVGPVFNLILADTSLAGQTVGWRVVPFGPNPIDDKDYAGGLTALSGSFFVYAPAKPGQLVAVIELADALDDGMMEEPETFAVELFETGTGQLLFSNGQAVRHEFTVIDEFIVTPPCSEATEAADDRDVPCASVHDLNH